MYAMYSVFETACLAVAAFHIQHKSSNQAKSGRGCVDKICCAPRNAQNQKMKAIGVAPGKSLFSCGFITCTIRD